MINKKRTKIICTIGPASENKKTLVSMVKAGMNVVRLNFSHGSYANHKKIFDTVKEVEKKTGEPVSIMQDLQGPKIRVGVLPNKGLSLKTGEMVSFNTSILDYKNGDIPIDYSDLHNYVKKGERIFLNDGRIEAKIVNISGTKIHTEIISGGKLSSHKGINVPDSKLEVRALTEKDKEDAMFGVVAGVDFIALSFVRSAEDILDLRYLIKQYKKSAGFSEDQKDIKIIAKIERKEAVDNIEEIIDQADGIMIARGDLGIEIPAQEVPLVQKKLIDIALDNAKPVIVATQMLDSMQDSPRPTRAEVSDVANAVIDHTDAVMLSNETAVGNYPVEVVKTMSNIIIETEKSTYDDLILRHPKKKSSQVDEVISEMSRSLAEDVQAKIILAASLSGDTARLISRYRPEIPIAVATNDERTRHQLNLSWGVCPFILPTCQTIEELIDRSIRYLKKQKIVKKYNKIIVVAGEPVGYAGNVNLLEVREV